MDIGAYYCSEVDPEAILVTKVNHSNSIIYLGDVREVDLEKVFFLSLENIFSQKMSIFFRVAERNRSDRRCHRRVAMQRHKHR